MIISLLVLKAMILDFWIKITLEGCLFLQCMKSSMHFCYIKLFHGKDHISPFSEVMLFLGHTVLSHKAVYFDDWQVFDGHVGGYYSPVVLTCFAKHLELFLKPTITSGFSMGLCNVALRKCIIQDNMV